MLTKPTKTITALEENCMLALRLSPVFAALTLAALSAGPLSVSAAPSPANDTSAEVIIGGTLIHTIRTPWGGKTAKQRATEVQLRLNKMLAQGPMLPTDFTVGQLAGDWCVLFRGQRFLTADSASAAQNHCSSEALARQWAAHLDKVLPELTKSKMVK